MARVAIFTDSASDLDPAEASAVLGCSPGTFAVRLHRALAALRGVLLTEQTDVA